jgi:hypothetical protein
MSGLEGANTTCWVCGYDYDDERHRLECPNSPLATGDSPQS